MSVNNEYNQDIEFLYRANITKESLQKDFEGNDRLNAMLSIYDTLHSQESIENLNRLSSSVLMKFSRQVDNSRNDVVNEWELDNYFEKYGDTFSSEITKEDLKEFLSYANQQGRANVENEQNSKLSKNKKIAEKLGVSASALDKIANHVIISDDNIKVVMQDNQRCIKITFDDGNYYTFDINGSLIETKDESCNHSSKFGELGEEMDEFTCTTKFKNGKKVSDTFINETTGEVIKYEGNTELRIKDGIGIKRSVDKDNKVKIDELIFDNDKNGKTKLSLKYDKNGNLVGLDVKDDKKDVPEDKPRGFISDGVIYFTHLPKPPVSTVISEETVKMIKDMLDNGAKYGKDFDLEVKDGKINLKPKIKNETGKPTPDLKGDALKQYKHLVTNNAHANEDFEVEYDEDGNFVYNYKNNQAREYGVDFKKEKYDKNGNKIYSMILKDGNVTEEKMVDGKMQKTTTPLDKKLLDLCISGDFANASKLMGTNIMNGGYNFYPLAEKYKEQTGNELILDAFHSLQPGAKRLCTKMTDGSYIEEDDNYWTDDKLIERYNEIKQDFENVVNFDPYKSPLADMLPKINRTQQDENHFTEVYNGKKYDVSVGDKQITVTNNGNSYKIDTSHLSKEFTKNVLAKLNAQVLFDMAISKVNLRFNEKMPDAHGKYVKDDNTIYIDPNSTTSRRMLQMISHEAGHMMDYIKNRDAAVNWAKEEMKRKLINTGRDKPMTVDELVDSIGDLASVCRGDTQLIQIFHEEFIEFKKANIKIDSEARYATTDIAELFAEVYALLTTGTCQSEYVLCNHFTRSVARIKELIETNRNYKLIDKLKPANSEVGV